MSDYDRSDESGDTDEEKDEKKEYAGENVGEELQGERHRKVRRFKTITKLEITRFSQYEMDYKESMVVPLALDLSDMGLTDIYPIIAHPYLAYLKLDNNSLTNKALEEPLSNLPNLISLYLSRNEITSTTLPRLEKLQQLNLESNPINVIEPIDQPNLEILILNKTKINTLQYIGMHSTPNLVTLASSHCYLKGMIGDYALTMQHLFLSYNEIKRIEGLESLVNLKTLHLRRNRISGLSGLTVGLDRLEYLNLRENEVSDPNELKKIQTLPRLREFIITDNPVDDEMGSDIRPMIIMYSYEVKRINKDLTDPEEVEYAKNLMHDLHGKEGFYPQQTEGEGDSI